MANALMQKWKEGILQATSNTSLTGTVKAILCRSAANTFSQSHVFVSDLTSPHATRSDALASKTYALGVFDAADFKFTAPAADTFAYNQMYLFVDTGSDATSRLVAFFDTGVTGLPVTPNGADVTITVNASGFFTL